MLSLVAMPGVVFEADSFGREVRMAGFLAQWLKESRERSGLGLRSLGAKAGVSHAHISNIEAGKASAKPEMVRLLAEAMGIDPRPGLEALVRDKSPELSEDEVRSRASAEEFIYTTETGRRFKLKRRGNRDAEEPFVLTEQAARMLEALGLLEEAEQNGAGTPGGK